MSNRKCLQWSYGTKLSCCCLSVISGHREVVRDAGPAGDGHPAPDDHSVRGLHPGKMITLSEAYIQVSPTAHCCICVYVCVSVCVCMCVYQDTPFILVATSRGRHRPCLAPAILNQISNQLGLGDIYDISIYTIYRDIYIYIYIRYIDIYDISPLTGALCTAARGPAAFMQGGGGGSIALRRRRRKGSGSIIQRWFGYKSSDEQQNRKKYRIYISYIDIQPKYMGI